MNDLFDWQNSSDIDPEYIRKQDEIEMVEGVPFKSPKFEDRNGPNNPGGKDLRVETARWIKKHPDVARLFLRYANALAQKERPFGMKLIAERVRWETYFNHGESYKISNNHTAYIARWIIAKDPSIENFIRFRNVKY